MTLSHPLMLLLSRFAAKSNWSATLSTGPMEMVNQIMTVPEDLVCEVYVHAGLSLRV